MHYKGTKSIDLDSTGRIDTEILQMTITKSKYK